MAGQWQNISVSDDLKRLMPVASARSDSFDSGISVVSSGATATGRVTHTLTPWQKFGKEIGWFNNAKSVPAIEFSGNAPAGHLPAPIWLSEWGAKSQDMDGKALEAAYQKMVQRLSQAGIKG